MNTDLTIEDYGIERIYALTPMQEGILYEKIADEASAQYVLQQTMRLADMDVPRMRKAMECLVQRHGVLRTMIMYRGISVPRQVLLKVRPPEFHYIETEDDQEYQRLKKQDVQRGFDLETETLIRMTVVKVRNSGYRLIVTTHHIIIDGWSLSILYKELFEAYADPEKYRELERTAGRFETFVNFLDSQDKEGSLQYWEDLLAGCEMGSVIRPMGFVEESEEESLNVEFTLSSELTEHIETTCAMYGVTLNTLAEACWGLLLQKYTYTNDVVFGKVVSGRNIEMEGIEDSVGLFINTIPVRVKTEPEDTFADLLHMLQSQALAGNDHDFCPLVEIQERSGQGSGLIGTLFAFENYYAWDVNIHSQPDFEFDSYREQTGYSIGLTFFKKETLHFNIMYQTKEYGKTEIELLGSHLLRIMEQSAKAPEIKLKDIRMIGEEEEKKIMDAFNATDTEYPREHTVIELFEDQVKRTPDNVAVVFGTQEKAESFQPHNTAWRDNSIQLTYRQFHARINRLAQVLQQKYDIQPGDFVAIMAEKSLEMITAIFAVVKSGAAYVPIDPRYPKERIELLLKDCRPKAILTQHEMSESASEEENEEKRPLNQDEKRNPVKCLKTINQPTDPICILYTSGSTGYPKGTIINHRNVIRLVKNTNWFTFDENIRLLQTGAISFDASTFEIWGPLLNGGSVYIYRQEAVMNPIQMKQLIITNRITTLFLTTSLCNQMIESDPEMFMTLKHLLTGGEKISEPHVRALKKKGKYPEFINAYGPTENTSLTTTHLIPDTFTKIPIGKPISNTKVYILNGNEVCGIGVPGELCTTGDGVTNGYLNHPELMAEKFVDNPFGTGTMYRTGDLARWLPDGNIEYLGRMDDQVKIRGFRIEPGEIESCLSELAGIKTAAVIMREDLAGEKSLCAYVTAESDIEEERIKEELRKVLPEYMVPAHIVHLETIPLTRNGKLDKAALPAPQPKTREYTAPRTLKEKQIAEAFEKILGIADEEMSANLEGNRRGPAPRISVTDSFFDWGGHSLKATLLCNELERITGVRLSLKEVFTLATPRRIAEKIQQTKAGTFAEIPKIAKAESYPMSAAQKRLYLLDAMMGPNVIYNIPHIIQIRQSLTQTMSWKHHLQETVNKLLEHEEILRTSFHIEDGETLQKVEKNVEVTLEYKEVMSEALDLQEEYRSFVRPFDLSQAPLLRLKILQTPKEVYLLSDIHHIISDGESVPIMLHRLNALYGGRNLPEPRIQYKDYSAWQNGRNVEEQADYWKREFSGEIPILDLKTDFPRPQEKSFRGSHIQVEIEELTCKAIKELAQKQGATEFMVILSAFFTLLGKYTCQEEIVIGTPVSGRVHADTEKMLGMFVNTIAIKGRPCRDESFANLLANIKDKCLQAYDNQEYPFEVLVEDVNVRRDISRNPIFDVMFVLQEPLKDAFGPATIQESGHRAGGPDESGGLLTGGKLIEMETSVAKFDLTLTVTPELKGYSANFEYCTDLFSQETISYMARHFLTVLKEAVFYPERKLRDLQMIDMAEAERIAGTKDGEADYPRDKTIVQLFEDQVARTPDHVAFVFKEQGKTDCQLTYAELNARANSLARKLRQDYEVQPDDFVAVLTERSLEMIIGIVAVLKSGAAYVPIDPAYPKERIEYILSDSSPKAALCGVTAPPISIPRIALTDISEQYGDCENPIQVNKPHDLMYVIYTSGTTGRPKGVMVEHINVVQLLKNSKFQFDFSENDVWTLFHSICFDFSIWEIFGSLLFGAKLIGLSEDIVKDAYALEEVLNKESVTVLCQVPSSFYTLMDITAGHTMESLRYVIFGGEALSPARLKTWHEGNSHCRLVNMYGTTETTVHASYREIQDEEIQKGISDIGKAIPTLQIHILNDKEICGIGVPGELCIAGSGVTRGYLNQPELTAEKFVDNPFGCGKMYRTGDLARWLPNGNAEYLGRLDDQVKIRGYRIELGEIETRLLELDGIKKAVVVAQKEATGEKILCAYIVREAGNEEAQKGDYWNDAEEIRAKLRIVLPEYMLPAHILYLDRIPLTANGKLNRAELPAPQHKTEKYTPPQNLEEKLVTEAFENILNIGKVSITDSFFDLGGHSLKATRLCNELEKRTGVRLPLKEIFALTTPRRIAERIRESGADQGKKADIFVPIPKVAEAESYPMSSAQKRLYILNEMMAPTIAYNIPAVIRMSHSYLRKDEDKQQLQKAIDKILEQEEILRTSFHHENGEFIQKIEPSSKVELKFSKYQEIDRETIQAEYDSFVQPFHLSQAPLMRVKLVETPQNTYLFMDIHHIISDGISQPLLWSRIEELYENKAILIPRVHYKDYSVWQNARDISEQAAYWQKEFRGEIPVLDLKSDYPRPQEASYRGRTFQAELEEETSAKVRELAKTCKATEFMVLMAAFMMLLSKYSRQEEIIVGTPLSGRIHADTEKMLGMFVNTLAIKGEVHPDENFETLLARLREKCLQAFDNQEYPFEDLVSTLEIKQDLSRNPLFDVMFVLQDPLRETDIFKGAWVPMETGIAKFDLTLTIIPAPQHYGIVFSYCTDLFSPETIMQMTEHYTNLIKNIIKNPHQKVKDIRMTDAEEEEKVLEVFNATQIEYPQGKTIADLFEEQTAKTPERTAVMFKDQTLSYTELNTQANRLAEILRQDYNIRPGDYVAILTERSLEMIIGIYAIIKSGGAYVPVDSAYPQERIRFILEDCGAKVLLRKTKQPVGNTDIPQLELTKTYRDSAANRQTVKKSTDIAYVIYTSGSTGRPKGVIIEERSAVNLLTHIIRGEELDQSRVILQKTSCVFDVSIWELFAPLLCGGRIVLPEPGEEKDPDKIAEIIKKYGVTDLSFVPSAFKAFLSSLKENDTRLDSLKVIQIAGEALFPQLVKSYKGAGKIVNYYGPTEGTVYLTKYACTGQENKIPIGKPIANTKIYIVNETELCGIGVPGELCATGEGVARGYLNQPEMTAEKFIVDPLGSGKMYRTGDLARWLPDGNIEYLGRIDDQVKIRGYRIEPGEIENRLLEIPGIIAAAVITWKDAEGEGTLCGYVVVAPERQVDTETLKTHLSKTLPDYLVPATIMKLDAIPLTPNGKLDKAALPKPQYKMKKYIAPRTPNEKKVAKAFEDILRIERVSITDNFFDLGGDSIKAIRILGKIREAGYDTTMRSIMVERTPELIAKGLRERQETLLAEQGEVIGDVPLTPIQHYFFWHCRSKEHADADRPLLVYPQHFNQSQLLEAQGKIDAEALQKALSALVEHHDMLRATLKGDIHSFSGQIEEFDSNTLCLAIKKTNEQGQYGLSECECAVEEIEKKAEAVQAGIVLTTGPLLHAVLFRTPRKDYLLLVIHHLVIDGVSWRILAEDLERVYHQALSGEDIKLPAKTSSFKAWSEGLRRYEENTELVREIMYWSKVTDKVAKGRLKQEGAPKGGHEQKIGVVCLDADTTNMLLKESHYAYNTEINDLLLTALGRAVHHITGQHVLALQMEGHGREEDMGGYDLSRTVGWFTSVYPVVLEELGRSVSQDIRTTKEILRRIPEHGLGYGILMQRIWAGTEADPEISTEKRPDITFNYLGEFGSGKGQENLYFTHSDLPRGHDIHPDNCFGTPVSINGFVYNGKLTMTISCNNHYLPETMEALCLAYKKELIAVAEHCCRVQASEPTASDFGETVWSDEDFRKAQEALTQQIG